MHQSYTITEIRSENYRTKTLVFDRYLVAQAGQFGMVWLPDVGERPYSIASSDPLSLMVVAVGPFSEALHRLSVGDRVWVRGPLGRGFVLPERPSGKHILLVAGGYGVAPLLFLARSAREAGWSIEVCIGARTGADILSAAAFAEAGAAVRITTEDGSAGVRGRVTAAMAAALRQRRPDLVCACGPEPMLEAIEARCRSASVPHQLSWEARMRCGLGICGACEVQRPLSGAWLTCSDGPVWARE
jgi:dihydroorotate dehydrogenase electron transfer subunit